jgi:hypothetical protein
MWVQQFAYRLPSLLVYIVAFILAIVFWSRARTACMLTMLGVVISVAASIGSTVMQAIVMQSMQDGGNMDTGRMMSAIGMTGTCAHSIGLMLFVAAIFVGRYQPPPELS